MVEKPPLDSNVTDDWWEKFLQMTKQLTGFIPIIKAQSLNGGQTLLKLKE